MESFEQENCELDAQPHACKRLGLAEISKRVAVRVAVRVRADMKAALIERLVYSQTVL